VKLSITAQQSAFFSKNGFLELELPHVEIPFSDLQRDLWRKLPALQNFLLKKIGPIALALTGKKQLALACDQVILQQNRPKSAGPIKEIFSIQGFALGIAIAKNPIIPTQRSPLGILPTPSTEENILFFKPEIILDWPHVKSDVYLALFALPTAVYIQNMNDPSTNFLKRFDLQFGDLLKNKTHPLVH
jgi:hypothetical protein